MNLLMKASNSVMPHVTLLNVSLTGFVALKVLRFLLYCSEILIMGLMNFLSLLLKS